MATTLVILTVLGIMAALYLMKPILVPLAMALMLACLLSPATHFFRRVLPIGSTGSAIVLFLLLAFLGIYFAFLTAESIVQALKTLPGDIDHMAQRLSRQVNDIIRDKPYLSRFLPESSTIDRLAETNQRMVIETLTYRLTDLTAWIAQGFIVLILVLFLLAESQMLAPKVIRFFAGGADEAKTAEHTLRALTRQIRAYLIARTLINIGMGAVVTIALWLLQVRFPIVLGVFAALTNFVPYVGQVVGGALPVLVTLGYSGSVGDSLIVAAVYLGVVGLEGYIVTPYVMGRSFDLNGTTVLIACLFWGFLWGMVGLILAMPITVSMKIVFQHVPALYRWAELMSRDWQPPPETVPVVEENVETLSGAEPLSARVEPVVAVKGSGT